MQTAFTGKTHNIECSEPNFPEFPDLLFGKTTEGIMYFDATTYLENKDITPLDFYRQNKHFIEKLAKAYEIKAGEIVILNKQGHYLIHSALAYLFLSFTEADFIVYLNERIMELFEDGFAISDTTLVSLANSRLPKSVLERMISENEPEG